MSNKKKVSFLDQINLANQESCEAAIKAGFICSLITISLTLMFAIIGLFYSSDSEQLNYLLDPYYLFDVIIMSVIAYYIKKKSRIATTIMFSYFILSKIFISIAIGAFPSPVLTLMFIFFYFNAMRASYIWHAKYVNNKESLHDFNI